MKKNIKKSVVAIVMAVAMAATPVTGFSAAPVKVQAASKKVTKIKFKKSSYTTRRGYKLNLSNQLKFTPSKPNTKAVTWKSSKKKVATVSSKGVVTAKKVGTVKITVTSKSNKKVKRTVTVKVKEAKKASKVKFKSSKYYIQKGKNKSLSKELKFTPTVPKSKSVTWKTSKKSYATVSSKGYVRTKKVGTTTITATSKSNKKAKGTTKVYVRYALPNLSFNHASSATVNEGNTYKLSVKSLSSSYYVSSTKYTTSNSNVATVDKYGKITAKSAGKATITVTKKGFNTKTLKFTITVEKREINKAGTYSGLNGDIRIKGSTTGKVVVNNSNIKTLYLEEGNYEVMVNNTTIGDVKAVEQGKKSTKGAISKVPTLTLGKGANVGTVTNTTPINVVMDDASAKITTVNAQNELDVTENVTPTTQIANVNIATTESVNIASPTENINVSEGNANVTVAAKVTNVKVNSNAAASDNATIKLTEKADVTSISTEKNSPVTIAVESAQAKVNTVTTKSGLTVSSTPAVTKESAGMTTSIIQSVDVQTNEPVTVGTKTAEVKVSDEDATLTVAAKVETVTVNAGTAAAGDVPAKKPTVNVTPSAEVTKVELTEEAKGGATVDGSGDIGSVTVPEEIAESVKKEITIPPTTKLDSVDSEGKTTTITEQKEKYKNVASTTDNVMKTFTLPLKSEDGKSDVKSFRLTKGIHKSVLTTKDIDDMINYFADPDQAYSDWTKNVTFPVDQSGIITIKTVDTNTKNIIVKGTSTKDGTYAATLTKSDDKYTLKVVDPKGVTRTATITKNGDSATLESDRYLVTSTAKSIIIKQKTNGETKEVFSLTKNDENYKLSMLADESKDISMEYLDTVTTEVTE
ncbi:MAG: Ig-like domain-containing protein [Anaerostipes sp.]|jgi:uncharacterized protein YjdB